MSAFQPIVVGQGELTVFELTKLGAKLTDFSLLKQYSLSGIPLVPGGVVNGGTSQM